MKNNMKNSELRIGNFVREGEGANAKAVRISKISPKKIKIEHYGNFYPLAVLGPLPLNHGWFYQFGFVDGVSAEYDFRKAKGEEFHADFAAKNFGGSVQTLNCYRSDENGFIYLAIGEFKIAKILFVHELQNWYYLLSGDELKTRDEKDRDLERFYQECKT